MSSGSRHEVVARGHRSIRRLLRGGMILLAVGVGVVAPGAAVADDCGAGLTAHADMTPSQRSIVLAEGQDPANFPAAPDGLRVHGGMTATQRSIALLEGKDPANVAAASAAAPALEVHAGLSPSERSIILAEGEDPANFPAVVPGC